VVNRSKITALVNRLAAGAPPSSEFADVIQEMGKRLVSAGIPVDQCGVYATMIHPEIPGCLTYWTEASGVKYSTLSPKQLREWDLWIGTPAYDCSQSGRMVIVDIGSASKYDDRTDIRHLAKRGYRQLVNLPLHSVHSISTNVASFNTKSKGGFTDEELHALREIQANFARVTEGFILHDSTVQILSTYVGRDAGIRVLKGNLLLGDSEMIPSIVLFTDLKNFTALSNTTDAATVIDTLNVFYGLAEKAIDRNGGEILKFMGDGLLAIFPVPDDYSAQVAGSIGAISAVEEMRARLLELSRSDIEFRASLHLGDIHYGNIGGQSRMDFTAIGPTVNLGARLIAVADEFGCETVCSSDFHQLVPEYTSLLGERTLKGFNTPKLVYKVASNSQQ